MRPIAAALAMLLAGCAIAGSGSFPPDASARPAVDAPYRFEPADAAVRLPADTLAGSGCRSPMVDPRNGTEIRFVRSTRERADYEVPLGRYGVGERELLRLDCNTGAVIGIVRR